MRKKTLTYPIRTGLDGSGWMAVFGGIVPLSPFVEFGSNGSAGCALLLSVEPFPLGADGLSFTLVGSSSRDGCTREEF